MHCDRASPKQAGEMEGTAGVSSPCTSRGFVRLKYQGKNELGWTSAVSPGEVHPSDRSWVCSPLSRGKSVRASEQVLLEGG